MSVKDSSSGCKWPLPSFKYLSAGRIQLRYWADQIMANLLFLPAKTAGRLSNNFTGSVCGGRERAEEPSRGQPRAAAPGHLLSLGRVPWGWGRWAGQSVPCGEKQVLLAVWLFLSSPAVLETFVVVERCVPGSLSDVGSAKRWPARRKVLSWLFPPSRLTYL